MASDEEVEIKIEIQSAGGDSYNIKKLPVYIKVDGVEVNGKIGRGLNVVILDGKNGSVKATGNFDTVEDTTTINTLPQFIMINLREWDYVLMAAADQVTHGPGWTADKNAITKYMTKLGYANYQYVKSREPMIFARMGESNIIYAANNGEGTQEDGVIQNEFTIKVKNYTKPVPKPAEPEPPKQPEPEPKQPEPEPKQPEPEKEEAAPLLPKQDPPQDPPAPTETFSFGGFSNELAKSNPALGFFIGAAAAIALGVGSAEADPTCPDQNYRMFMSKAMVMLIIYASLEGVNAVIARWVKPLEPYVKYIFWPVMGVAIGLNITVFINGFMETHKNKPQPTCFILWLIILILSYVVSFALAATVIYFGYKGYSFYQRVKKTVDTVNDAANKLQNLANEADGIIKVDVPTPSDAEAQKKPDN
jgi:hypothetical protein